MPSTTGTAALVQRAAARLTMLAAASVAVLALGPAPASADSCPNAALRAQSDSTALPDCRAYELVSSPYKEGFAPVARFDYSDGGAFSYYSKGNFADNGLGSLGGNLYVARRSPAGWQTTSPGPSGPAYNKDNLPARALSPDLSSSLWLMARADQSTIEQDFYVRDATGAFTLVGPSNNPAALAPTAPGGSGEVIPTVNVPGASADLSHVIFSVQSELVYPGTTPAPGFNLYEYASTGNDRPRLVGLDNDGHQITTCDQFPGASNGTENNAISADGRVIFWTAVCAPDQLWARVGGTLAYDVSASLCARGPGDPGGACDGPSSAVYQGAATDGSRVFFTTSQQLVDGDTDATSDLYACDIPPGTPAPTGPANACAPLREVSGAATGAGVEGVMRISDDGSRVYFVATGVLAANAGANGAVAAGGDHNLYVWHQDAAHPGGQTTFVGKLDPGDGILWGDESGGNDGRRAQTTADGRYLVLSTRAPLVAAGPSADTDAAADMYRYDADTQTIVRLSTGPDGTGGNAAGADAFFFGVKYTFANPGNRQRTAMSADARTVVFRTSEALVPADVDGVIEVSGGPAGLVWVFSGGRPAADAEVEINSYVDSSGDDIYFTSTSSLTPDDTDTQLDVYDARVGGGFDFPSPVPCSGEQCQGAASPPPGLAVPATGGPSGGADAPPVTPAFSLRRVSAAQLKRLAGTGKLTLTLTSNTAATLSAKATATIARRATSVASARRTVARAGTASLALTLSRKARAQLAADGKLTVKVVVASSAVAIDRSVTLRITRAKAKRPATKRTAGRS